MFDSDYNGRIDGKLISKEPLYSNPPSQSDIEHIIALYDGEIRQTDEDLGEFFKFIKKANLFDNSIIIILGDHGEQFYEHGNTSHHGLYDELLHIPMAWHIPESDSTRYDHLVSQVDVLPTILDYTGSSDSFSSFLSGKSLKFAVENNTKAREDVFAEYTGSAIPDSFMIRSDSDKAIFSEGNYEVYDLRKDKHEMNPIDASKYSVEQALLVEKLKTLIPH